MALQSLRLSTAIEKSEVPAPVVVSLAAYIEKCYEAAKTEKDSVVTERLLKCERQRRGEYDPDKAALIRETGGSDIYLMLTDIKCRAAESWIKDVTMSSGQKTWSLAPTPEPSLPNEMREGVIETVVMEADAVSQQGMAIDPRAIDARMKELYDAVTKAIAAKAKDAALKMEERMHDKLVQANWSDTQAEVIYDFVTFPASIVKGPIIRRKRVLKWGSNWRPKVEEEIVESFTRVSPYDIYPSPSAVTCQDGYIIERHRLSRADLSAMIGTPGYNDDAIRAALDQFGRTGIRSMQAGDNERATLEGRTTTLASSETIEAIEFWGAVSGSMLIEWGLTKDIDPSLEYEVNCWKVGPHVIRAIRNPDPLGRRPYSKASWEAIPGAFWGVGLPEVVRDVQTMCNAAARALANNMGIASGPQVEVNVDRLPTGENLTQMYPWKIWQTTSDRTGGGQAAVRFFQPDMNADTLMAVLQYFQKVSDEVTGVPNYVYGSTSVAGAGRTASGLSMLMENAAKGIKQAILSLDKATSEMLTRLYDHLMIYDDDKSIKGDMQIVASGVVGTLLKETMQARRNEFMQMTANPFDMQIIGPAGRAELLRQAAEGLNIDVNKIVPDPKEILAAQQAQIEAEAANAEAQMQQQAMPADPQLMAQPAPQPQGVM
jgi:hypothetical protein